MKKPFGWYIGYILAAVVFSCLAIVVIAFILGITAKALTGLLLWLF